jgi:exodeoxyribonuclease VII large subunit
MEMTSTDSNERAVYTVGELNELLRALIEDSLPSLWVQGEISNFARPASGHWYFTLKDAQAQIRCAMFRNANFYVKPQPKEGDAVLVRARAGIYPARGELQLIVEHMEAAGTGALLRAFEALKSRLAAEGLFDPSLKRALPELPRRIGLITSATGAAVHDVLTTLQRRWPLAEVLLYPVLVQGTDAPPAIIKALQELPARAAALGAPVDTILLVRGGGSLEDLWAFNDEGVARAIRACTVPVVCGIGHETDTTIADFVADLRAATPTAAAERITPDIAEWSQHLRALSLRIRSKVEQALIAQERRFQALSDRLQRQNPVERRLRDRAQRIDELSTRLTASMSNRLRERRRHIDQASARLSALQPRQRIALWGTRVNDADTRLQRRMREQLATTDARLRRATDMLAALNPQAVLERGYAIARLADGRVLQSTEQVETGQHFELQLHRGRLTGAVVAKRDKS